MRVREICCHDEAKSREKSCSDTDSSRRNSAGGALYYSARVTLDRSTMNIDGKDVKLTPGMAATVEIKTGKRKLIEFLLSPPIKMTNEAGRER
jgi:hemolysin D